MRTGPTAPAEQVFVVAEMPQIEADGNTTDNLFVRQAMHSILTA